MAREPTGKYEEDDIDGCPSDNPIGEDELTPDVDLPPTEGGED